MGIIKNHFRDIGLVITQKYADKPLDVKRKVYYNLFILGLCIITCVILQVMVLAHEAQEHGPLFFFGILAIALTVVLVLLVRGYHWLPILLYTAVIFHSQIQFFAELPANQEAMIISILSFVNVMWLLIASSWWHWAFYLISLINTFRIRMHINLEALRLDLIPNDDFILILNAYFILAAMGLLSITVYFLLKREQIFTQKNLKLTKEHEAMYLELVNCFNANTSKVKIEDQSYLEGYFDQGTHCLNRLALNRFFLDNYERLSRDHQVYIAYLDLDGLKRINDSMGHHKGDEYLSIFVKIVKKLKNEEDVLYRIGGDEFLLIAMNQNLETFETLLVTIQKKLVEDTKRLGLEGNVSFGIAHNKERDDISVDELIEEADQAMYVMKKEKYKLNFANELNETS